MPAFVAFLLLGFHPEMNAVRAHWCVALGIERDGDPCSECHKAQLNPPAGIGGLRAPLAHSPRELPRNYWNDGVSPVRAKHS